MSTSCRLPEYAGCPDTDDILGSLDKCLNEKGIDNGCISQEFKILEQCLADAVAENGATLANILTNGVNEIGASVYFETKSRTLDNLRKY